MRLLCSLDAIVCFIVYYIPFCAVGLTKMKMFYKRNVVQNEGKPLSFSNSYYRKFVFYWSGLVNVCEVWFLFYCIIINIWNHSSSFIKIKLKKLFASAPQSQRDATRCGSNQNTIHQATDMLIAEWQKTSLLK